MTNPSTGIGTDNPSSGIGGGVVTPPAGAVVADGATVNLSKADNTGALANVVANVVDDVLENFALPANKAVLTDQQASVTINQYGQVGGAAATVGVAANEPNLTLANSTSRIVFDAQPCSIKRVTGDASGFGGLLSVGGGALNGLTLPADVALVQDGTGIAVPVTGTYTNTITPTVDANGVITGFVLS